jgi:hypothetical protein
VSRALRKINGSNRHEITWNWKRPHNEELHDPVWETGLINSNVLWVYLRKGDHFEDGELMGG